MNYRQRRAKKGHGALRAKLLKELRLVEGCVEHSIILTYDSGRRKVPQEWLDQRKKFEAERDALVIQLDAITHPLPDHEPEFTLGDIVRSSP